ncbi:MAG TPA: cold-shock protein [Oceanospirillales bacterium]|nr:cold-shock protein [Oceanospirillales bacterium]
MSNVMIRKIVVAVIFAVLTPLIVASLMVSPLISVAISGEPLTTSNLFSAPGMPLFLLILALFGLIGSFLSAQLVPSRRRRYRSSGTVVEEDVEDGRERGVVKWFNVKKGFGFITWDQGEDVFVHFRSIRGQGHRSLTEGQRVKFNVVQGDKGPQAEDVSALR